MAQYLILLDTIIDLVANKNNDMKDILYYATLFKFYKYFILQDTLEPF